ncbi:MAG TPA: tripartite tricarboxylate transporter permease [Burkholderiaceae bacterium]|nr:tripartite tricarboxylate transporter permease [Burkholderiaceae bacterium]
MENLLMGFQVALTLENLLYSLIGVFFGNLVGVIPGIGAMAAISMLLPMTYSLPPTGALMMLAGIYYGTSYGGAITAIMLNLPGVPTHAVACLDGYPLARQGKAGKALLMTMVASFLGASTGILLMTAFGPVMVAIAFKFTPMEYFSLMALGLLAASMLSVGSPVKGIFMVLLGLLLGVVGTDITSGVPRFTFGLPGLMDGLVLVAVAMGFYGISEVFQNVDKLKRGEKTTSENIGFRSLRLPWAKLKACIPSIARGTGVGSFVGVLPGVGGAISSFMAYAVEKNCSKNPERFGRGALEGVASSEAANSAAAQTSFIPTLSLGIPGDAVMALMLAAMMIHNIQPGPQMMISHPTIFWGLIASFWIGNVMLLMLNIPLIGIWTRLLSIPYRFIFPAILLFVCVGVFSANNSMFDVKVVLLLGVLGYVLSALRFEPAPLLLGVVLGPMVEENFRRSLLLSNGDLSVFITRPISGACVLIGALMIIGLVISQIRKRRGRSAMAPA